MDARVMVSTFTAVFLAELGDKTQIAVLTLGVGAKDRWAVFAGASIALVLSTLVAILVADFVARRLDVRWTHGIAGVVLIAMGAVYLVGAVRGGA